MPDQLTTGCGSRHRKCPSGGAANGIPSNTPIPPSSFPARAPPVTCTIGGFAIPLENRRASKTRIKRIDDYHLANQWENENMNATTEKAILAGGCFWGMQDLIRRQPGVISTRVGYTGGDVVNATYRNHGTHAEAIEILFDPQAVSYRDLLEFFFQIHDPTTLNRQGNDRGTSYRSAIFYTSDEQKRTAEEIIGEINASGVWPGKVVTEVAPAGPFWEAEPEHQDYLEHYPSGYTCHFIRPDWKLRSQAARR
jgi:peptide-methionine (S)-S-oxide reductase